MKINNIFPPNIWILHGKCDIWVFTESELKFWVQSYSRLKMKFDFRKLGIGAQRNSNLPRYRAASFSCKSDAFLLVANVSKKCRRVRLVQTFDLARQKLDWPDCWPAAAAAEEVNLTWRRQQICHPTTHSLRETNVSRPHLWEIFRFFSVIRKLRSLGTMEVKVLLGLWC